LKRRSTSGVKTPEALRLFGTAEAVPFQELGRLPSKRSAIPAWAAVAAHGKKAASLKAGATKFKTKGCRLEGGGTKKT
jgi:hypothetical protein